MTIAELQLARMRPLALAPNSLAELDRARQSRRHGIGLIILLWAGLWLYGVDALLSASDIGSGLDRFLPIQLLAAVAAVAALIARRAIQRGALIRRICVLPATVTLAGALTLVWVLNHGTDVSGSPGTAGHPPFPIQVVSL